MDEELLMSDLAGLIHDLQLKPSFLCPSEVLFVVLFDQSLMAVGLCSDVRRLFQSLLP